MKYESSLCLRLAVCLGCCMLAVPLAAAQTAQPSAKVEQRAAGAVEASIDPRAAELLARMKAAYGKLNTLDVSGKVSNNIDAYGQTNRTTQEFTGSFAAPNKFRHQSKTGWLFGSTGEKVYAYSPSKNEFYMTKDASKQERFEHLPAPIGGMLFSANPSMFMAISREPMQLEGAIVKRLDDVTIDGTACPALHVSRQDGQELTLVVDPATYLLRRMTMDLRKTFPRRGELDVKAWETVIDYTATTPDAQPKPEHFAWAPPDGARDAAQPAPRGSRGKPSVLEGKAAPAFTLKNLHGEDVKLADLKGKVVVLDFWATWCAPCVASLPALDALAKRQGDAGAKVFAVDIQEQTDKVRAFVRERNLSLPVLLDADGEIGEAYKAEAIPQTVVIGKDGNVRKVFVGANEKALEREVDAALTAQ